MKKYAVLAFCVAALVAAVVYGQTLLITLGPMPEFVQKKAAATNSSTTQGITFNAQPAAGDYLICAVAYNNATATLTPPANFNLLGSAMQASNLQMSIFGRFATVTDTAGPYTFGISTAGGIAVSCEEWAGVDQTTPIAGTSTAATNNIATGSQVLSPTAITPSISGTQPVSFFSTANELALTPGTGYYNDKVATTKTSGASAPVSLSQFRAQFASTNTTSNVSATASATFSSGTSGAFGLVLLNHIGGMPSGGNTNVTPAPQASPTPTLAPTPLASVIPHLGVYTDTNGCWHNSNNSCLNAGMPSPLAGPTASSAQVQSDINIAAKYLNFWQTDTRMTNFGHAAGIKMGSYYDWLNLHLNSGTLTNTTFPSSIIAKTSGGASIFLPNNNAGEGGTFLGDPTTSGTGSLLTYANGQISQIVNGQYGPFNEDFARGDDGDYPGHAASYTLYCSGFFSNGNSTVSSCPSAQPQVNPSTYPYVGYPPIASAWATAIKYFYQNLSLPVIWNDFTSPLYAVLLTTNTMGVQCELCIQGWPQATWENQLNAGLVAILNQITMIYFRLPYNNAQQELFDMASLGLIAGDGPQFIAMQMEPQSTNLIPPSGIAISVYGNIVPTNPVGGSITFDPIASNYNDNAPQTTLGVGRLKTATGIFAREYNACYIKGVYAGPCAYLVNSDTASHARPTLTRTYTHTTSVTGLGVMGEFGDTGSLSINGGAPPSTMATKTGEIDWP